MIHFFLRNKIIVKKCYGLRNFSKSASIFSAAFLPHKIKAYMHTPISNIHMLSRRRLFGVVGFKLSDIGEGIAEVELIKWHKNVGDEIEEMENLCTVQSDKAAVDITSRYTGVIKHMHFKEGDIIKIGSILIDVDTPDADVHEDINEEKIEEKNVKEITSQKIQQNDHTQTLDVHDITVIASPACRRLAKELNVDLKKIIGTGKGGKISKEDIEEYAKNLNAAKKESSNTSSQISSSSFISSSASSSFDKVEDIEVQIKGYSRAMVKMMTESLKIPHLNIGDEYDITELMKARQKLKDIIDKEYGVKITITSLIIKAMSLSLKSLPILNSKIDPSGTKYTIFGNHNISVAIDTPNGLVVPNIKAVQNLSVIEIQKELIRLQKMAVSNNLTPDDLKGGTISLSNVGVIAGTYIKPLLFDGQAMIMGLGRIRNLPRFDMKKNLCEKHILNCSFSADHRHCDGATVARFAALLKKYLENPELMFFCTR